MHACMHTLIHTCMAPTFSDFYPDLLSLRILMGACDNSRSLLHFCFSVMGFSRSSSWHTMIGTHSLFTSTTTLCDSNMAPKAKKVKEIYKVMSFYKETLSQEHKTVARLHPLFLVKKTRLTDCKDNN